MALGLTDEGFVVEHAATGTQANELVLTGSYDLIVLDVMLPGKDGFSLCEQWRGRGIATPILFVTARDAVAQRVRGLQLGGDDYLIKPFAFEELVMRIRTLLRRSSGARPVMRLEGGALLNLGTQQVQLDATEVTLTMREWQILECLALAAGRIVSRNVLWESVWESGAAPDSNLIDVYIRRLREKLGMESIETVRGTGYRLRTANL
ncbi:response regulator transcription factor [Armatimonas sp.]|uniref:response regulator transcription factor n=1 Tax=Armatimonas sp. TaxID=1872638 RepID=UPI00286A55A1|nr:response regulator transcription factor [Armatimonas sp.]